MAFGALFFYLKQHPHDLSHRISSELQSRTGMELVFSSIDVTLLPLPALSFANVKLKDKNFTLDVAYATVTPSLISLIKGDFSLGKISLWRPILNWHQQTEQVQDLLQNEALNAENIAETHKKNAAQLGKHIQSSLLNIWGKIPSFFYNSSLQVLHGNFSWQHKKLLLQSENINAQVKLGLLDNLNGEINFKNIHILSDSTLMLNLGDLNINLSGDVSKEIQIDLNSYFTAPKLLEKGNISFSMLYTKPTQNNATQSKIYATEQHNTAIKNDDTLQNNELNIKGNWDFSAGLLWKEASIPAKTSGNFTGDISSTINFTNFYTQFGKDSLLIDAALNLKDIQKPVLKGTINVEHFSLSQWFGFVRQLPTGLQHALDNIEGNLDFILNKQGLAVPQLQAAAKTTGAVFTGKGSVSDWYKPVIFLDVSTNALNLKTVLPELEGIAIENLNYTHEPLTPVPGIPTTDNQSISLSYDINIHADELLAFDMPLGKISFRCLPTDLEALLQNKMKELPKKHKDAATLLFSTENFYGGQGNARAVLYRNAVQEGIGDTIYEITAQLQNVAALKPVARIVGKNLLSGTLSLKTNISTKGQYVSEILLSKKGHIDLQVKNGVFYAASGKKTPFKQLNIEGAFTAKNPGKVQGDTMPKLLQYMGKWQASLDMPDIFLKGAWNGALEFVGENYSTIQIRNFLGTLETKLSSNLTSLPHQLSAKVQGNYSLNTAKEIVELKNAKGSIPSLGNVHFNGKAQLNFAHNIIWSASGKASTDNLDSLLKSIHEQGKSSLPPTFPQNANLNFSANYAKNNLRLDKLSLMAEDIRISGKIDYTLAQNPSWKFNLTLNELNYDKYFSDTPGIGYTHVRGLGAEGVPVYSNGQSFSSNPTSWQWLKGLQANGTVKIGLLKVKKLSFGNISSSVKINNGTLQLNALKASLYGGNVAADFMGTLQNETLQTRIKLNVKGTDLLAFTRDLHMDTVFSGIAGLSLTLHGDLGQKKVLAGLSGQWSMHVANGFMQSSTKDGKLTGDPTKIDSFSDSGFLSNGILQSKNFKLYGPDIKIIGGGYINLVNDTLDMNLKADLGYVVDIPVRFYGKLDKPERSLNTGAVVIAAIGSIGTGVFDLIGGIFGTLFGVFQ